MKQFLFVLTLLLGFSLNTKAQDLNIVFIGNSITQGAQLQKPLEEAPPVQACNWLQKQNIGKVTFRNCGVSGRTTMDFLPVADKLFPQVKAAADELVKNKGTLVFSIVLGTNDSAVKGVSGAPVLPVVYYSNMKSIVDELIQRYPSCKVVLNRPTWYSPNTYNNSTYLAEGLARLQSYFPMLEKLVKHYSENNAGQVFAGDTLGFNYFKEHYLTDLTPENGNAGTFYLHPNKTGAEKLGEFWGKAILKTLNKPESQEYSLNTVNQAPATDGAKGMLAPSLRLYLPDPEKATGRMIIACPGGAYGWLSLDNEGSDFAQFFLSQGIAFGVLKYRMPNGNPSIPFSDVEAAFKLVKSKAQEWHINPNDIGIMGSSAGGHLAATYATHAGKELAAAFQILLYPVITMDPAYTHEGSRKNLIGGNPSPAMVDLYSNEKQVKAETPRAFIILAANDKAVVPYNSVSYFNALNQKNIPVSFHIYPEGGHGFGYSDGFRYKKEFLTELRNWLKSF